MDDRQRDLSNYRIAEADDSLKVAEHCLKEGWYKDSINRSYYAAFYAVKAVLALSTVDFKRHKDVMGYFNRIKQVPCFNCAKQKAVGWDLLVSGVVQATPDKLRSGYSVISK